MSANHLNSLKKSDVIEIGVHKYLIYKVGRNFIEILPVTHLFQESEPKDYIIPKLRIAKDSLNRYTKLDSKLLIFLLHRNDPNILELIHHFLDNNEKKYSR